MGIDSLGNRMKMQIWINIHNLKKATFQSIGLLTAILMLSTSSLASSPTLNDFVLDASLLDVALSPNGKYLAEITNINGVRNVTVKDISKPNWPKLSQVGDDIIRPHKVAWATNQRLLIHLRVPTGAKHVRKKAKTDEDFDIDDFDMVNSLLAMDIDAKNMIAFMGNKSFGRNLSLSNIQHYLPKDPDHILVSTYRNNKKALYKVNINDGEPEFVVRGSRYTYAFITDKSGVPKFRVDYLYWSKKINIYRYIKDNDWDKIDSIYLDQDDQEAIKIDGFIGIIGEELVYRQRNEKTGYYEMIGIRRSNDKPRVIASLPDQDIHSVVLTRRTKEIIGYSTEDDNVRLRFLDSEKQIYYDKIASYLDGYNFTVTDHSDDTNESIVSFWGPDNPGAFAIYNGTKDKMTLLGYSYPELATEKLSLPAVTSYKTRDGVKIRNYILLPNTYKKGTRLPMIVLPHGGPQYRSRMDYSDFAQFLSTRGYIVIQPNFRGSTGYGRSFEEAGYKQWGQRMQDDVTDAVNFMISQGFAEPRKICIVGMSYGGYAALMGAIRTPNLYQCAISINGVTHLRDQIDHDIDKFDERDLVEKDFIEKYLFRRIGNPDTDKTMLDKYSPALQSDKIEIPLLIIAGEDDDIVPIEQAETLIDALEDHGKKFEYLEVEDAAHNVMNSNENTEKVYKKVEEFLAQHLLD